MARKTLPQEHSQMIVGGGETYVSGENLKQVDAPIEALLGVANGALSGGILATAISAVVTMAENGLNSGRMIMQNIKGNHLVGIITGALALATLGGVVRYSRARKHNEWTERHYQFMKAHTEGEGFTDKEDMRNAAIADQGMKR